MDEWNGHVTSSSSADIELRADKDLGGGEPDKTGRSYFGGLNGGVGPGKDLYSSGSILLTSKFANV